MGGDETDNGHRELQALFFFAQIDWRNVASQ
jgi:hypothetical protein